MSSFKRGQHVRPQLEQLGDRITPAELLKSLVYYGWPSGINGAANNIAVAAAEFANYNQVVLGGGIEETTHGDHTRTAQIIAHPNASQVKFFGYVPIGGSNGANLSDAVIADKITKWKNMGVVGILLDEFGYDYNVTRTRQNLAVSLAHSLGLSVIANGWIPSDVFSPSVHAMNPSGTPTQLNSGDFYMAESYQVINGNIADPTSWETKRQAIDEYRKLLNFGVIGLTTSTEANGYTTNEFNYAVASARVEGFTSLAIGEPNYSAWGAFGDVVFHRSFPAANTEAPYVVTGLSTATTVRIEPSAGVGSANNILRNGTLLATIPLDRAIEIIAGPGNLTVEANTGNTFGPLTITGGSGPDSLLGGLANDTMNGGAGNDTMYGFGGNDSLLGGIGNDVFFGGINDDKFVSGEGADTLDGGPGRNDHLTDRQANDVFTNIENVTDINDPPVALASSVTTNEDVPYTFASGNFLYSDEENNSLTSITIATLSLASGDTLRLSGTDVTANQTIAVANIPNLVYSPAANANGAARSTFTFKANDADLGSVAATMTITVTAVNDLPVAQNSSVTTNEDTPFTFASGNFLYSDVENDPLASITITSLSLASGDTLRLSGTDVTANQTITAANIPNLVYTPASDANGAARSTFTFRVNDAGNGVTAATMTINVTAVNDVPVAQNSSVTTNEDVPRTFSTGNFLYSDVENDALASITITSLSLASGDLLRLSGSNVTAGQTITAVNVPNLVYTPAANLSGSARSTFQFRVNDAGNGVTAATMTMNVNAVNDVPVAQASSVTINEDATHTFAVANFQFTDVESDPLASITISGLTLASGDLLRLSGSDVSNGQTITAANIPNLVYTPTANGSGTPRSTFQFKVNDAGSGVTTATMSLNVTAINDLPIAQASSVTTNEDVSHTFASSNFLYTDVENDPIASITIASLSLASGDTLRLSGSDVTANQTITAANIPNLVYTPASNANGAACSTFMFRVNDAGLGVTAATMTINVTAINDVPVAQPSSVTTNEDTAYTFASGNFLYSDAENDALVSITITSLSLASGDTLKLSGADVTANQTITAANIANLGYTPVANANGAARSTFIFRVNDAGNGTVAATMTINVTAVNDLPVAQASSVTTNEDVPYTFASGNFLYSDVENDPLASVTISSLSLASGDTLKLSGSDVTAGQTITAANIPNLVYTPAANLSGSARSTFQFRVNDAGNGVTTATMTMNVNAVNDVPVAQASSVTINEDATHTFAVGNFQFTDVETDPLASITISGLSLASGDLLRLSGSDVGNGQTITAANIPNLVYTPTANGNGTPRSTFQFKVNDAGLGTVAATMSLNVTPVNDLPIAQASSVTTNEDVPYTFAVGNFLYTDVENDPIASVTISSLTLASGDTLRLSGSDVTAGQTITAANIPNLVYTPLANVNGAARSTFQFRVNDAGLGVTAATFTLNVTNINDAPIAQASGVTTTEDTPRNFASTDFLFTDVENDPLASITIQSLSLASGDTLKLSGANVTTGQTITVANIPNLAYAPALNGTGAPRSTFTFTANDATNGIVAATMSVTVTNVNDVPVAQPSSITINEDSSHTFAVANFQYTDGDGDALASITIQSLGVASGDTLKLSGTDVLAGQTISAANIVNLVYTPASNTNGTPRSSFVFTVNDAASNGVASATFSLNVNAVNDPPTATSNSATLNEDTPYPFAVPDFPFTDAEADSLVSITVSGLTLASGDTLKLSGTSVTNGQTISAVNLANLVYTPANNASGSARSTFSFTANDSSVGSTTAIFTLNVTEVNDAPVAQASSVTTSEETPHSFSVANFSFTDVESDGLVSVTIQTLNLASGDTLQLNGTNVSANQTITVANIPNLVYTPASNASGPARSSFVFTVNDATNGTTSATMTLNVGEINDTPVVDTNYFPMFPALPAKPLAGTPNLGAPISRVVEHVSDVDGDPQGIAITQYDASNGQWQYSLNNAGTWVNFPTVSDTSALLLADDWQTRVRFVPRVASKGVKAFTKGFASLNFKAWDQSDGATPGTQSNTTTGSTAYSAVTETGWVAIGKAAPTMDVDGHPVLKSIALPKSPTTAPKPSTAYVVKKFLGLLAKETNPTQLFGIAISGVSGTGLSGTGEWQFNTGKGWHNVGTVSDGAALLLRPTDKVRFMKGATFDGHADITYHTWDLTGTFGTKVAISGSNFSIHTETAVANAAPILTPTLPSLGTVQRGTTTAPVQVGTLLSATDVDQTTLGMYISGPKGGTWEYSADGVTWTKLTKAAYLEASAYLRFTAAATAKVGSVGKLTFKAWDQTLQATSAVSKLKDTLSVMITA